tara:strand:+ start:133 stop:270 length:138 start_codon:yes stop_codon:yes gene_type:complete
MKELIVKKTLIISLKEFISGLLVEESNIKLELRIKNEPIIVIKRE